MMEWTDRHCRVSHRLLVAPGQSLHRMVTAKPSAWHIASGGSGLKIENPVAFKWGDPTRACSSRRARKTRATRDQSSMSGPRTGTVGRSAPVDARAGYGGDACGMRVAVKMPVT